MTPTYPFTIRPVEQGEEADVYIHVEAPSARQAAQAALGETLVLNGPPRLLRARVWRLNDDLTPICTELFTSEYVADETS